MTLIDIPTQYQEGDFQRCDSELDNKMIENKFNDDPTAIRKQDTRVIQNAK